MAGPVEFDEHAADYQMHHARNIAITGEEPEFFAEYKIADALGAARREGIQCNAILDFGAGIGGSIPFFRTHFPSGALTCADVSARSLGMASARFPGDERMVAIDETAGLALPNDSFDLCFSACVFHHIAHERHGFWLRELRRVTRPGGLLIVFEHNPLNPLTVRAVNTCPFDVNAHLIGATALTKSVADAGWQAPRVRYRLFFPRLLAKLRPIERFLTWCPLGAQYYVRARKPA
ncbi:MAG: class I SAM-dependent methyltransferase [Acetobacteraceae bacterium]